LWSTSKGRPSFKKSPFCYDLRHKRNRNRFQQSLPAPLRPSSLCQILVMHAGACQVPGPLLVYQDRDPVPVLRRVGRELSGERGEMRRRRVSVGKHFESICRLGEGPTSPWPERLAESFAAR